MKRRALIGGILALVFVSSLALMQSRFVLPDVMAAGAHSEEPQPPADDTSGKQLSPQEKMNRRFPHPARVGDLIGLPVLDWDDSTIGFVQDVARTPGGQIQL